MDEMTMPVVPECEADGHPLNYCRCAMRYAATRTPAPQQTQEDDVADYMAWRDGYLLESLTSAMIPKRWVAIIEEYAWCAWTAARKGTSRESIEAYRLLDAWKDAERSYGAAPSDATWEAVKATRHATRLAVIAAARKEE
jgi:hypothetical protein